MSIKELLSFAYRVYYKDKLLDISNEIDKSWENLPNYKKIGTVITFLFKDLNDDCYYLNSFGNEANQWNLNKKEGSLLSYYDFSMRKFTDYARSKDTLTDDFFLCLDIIEKITNES